MGGARGRREGVRPNVAARGLAPLEEERTLPGAEGNQQDEMIGASANSLSRLVIYLSIYT